MGKKEATPVFVDYTTVCLISLRDSSKLLLKLMK